MSGHGDPPDDLPDRAPAVSSGSQRSTNGLAREWALCEERERADQLFEALIRAVEAELLTSARAMAYKLVGAHDGEDAISTVWAKLLAKRKRTIGSGQAERDAGMEQAGNAEQAGNKDSPGGQPGGFDPGRGTFTAYFLTAVHNTCVDILRRRNTAPQPSADATTRGESEQCGLFPDVAGPEDKILRRLEGIQDRITAAIEVLDLSDKHRDMLRLMIGTGEAAPPADPKAAAAARQQKKRLRDKVAKLAGLTPDELEAASLVRTHHTVAAAADAAPGIDVPGLFASAKRKVFALFDIETED